MKKTAVILLSGGLDSTTCVAIAKDQGFELYGLTINYGQKHIFEIESAKLIANYNNIKNHSIIDINLAHFGGSALTSDNMKVPKNRNVSNINDIPATYVPARNTVFLSIALARAETTNSFDIFIGVNALDYSGYPDCRPAFISEFEKLANLATKKGVEKNSTNFLLLRIMFEVKWILQQGSILSNITHRRYRVIILSVLLKIIKIFMRWDFWKLVFLKYIKNREVY